MSHFYRDEDVRRSAGIALAAIQAAADGVAEAARRKDVDVDQARRNVEFHASQAKGAIMIFVHEQVDGVRDALVREIYAAPAELARAILAAMLSGELGGGIYCTQEATTLNEASHRLSKIISAHMDTQASRIAASEDLRQAAERDAAGPE